MTTSVAVRFTPLYGAKTDTALSYLLEIDDTVLLLDCGWNEDFDESLLAPLREVAPRVDAVLISHSDLAHSGALPYAFAKLGLRCRVYMTFPVYKMGQLFLYDACQSKLQESEATPFTLDDIDDAFAQVKDLRYSQEQVVKGVICTPYAAGHMVGGAIWRIQKETETILYAMDLNQRKERHLNGCDITRFSRPSLLICDAMQANVEPIPKDVLSEFVDTVVDALRHGGNVLVPVDTAGRVLEVALALEQKWEQTKLRYPVVICNSVSSVVADFATRFMEWMNDSVSKHFDAHRHNPFEFKFVETVQDLTEILAMEPPMVVLASFASMDFGIAKELFVEWASNDRNLIALTSPGAPGSRAHQLLNLRGPATLVVSGARRRPLTDEKLQTYLQEKRQQERQAEQETKRQLEEQEFQKGIAAAVETEDVDMEDEDGAGGAAATRNMFQKYPMFDWVEKQTSWTEYGEAIDTSEFVAPITAPTAIGDVSMSRSDALESKTGEIPTELIPYTRKVHVCCHIRVFNLEGRIDGRSLRHLIDEITPRKLVLVHGSPSATADLLAHCSRSYEKVFAPEANQCLDMSSDTITFRATMRDDFFQSLVFHDVGDYDVAHVDAQIEEDTSKQAVFRIPAGGAVPYEPTLIRAGPLQLPVLRNHLRAAVELQSEIAAGGTLVVNSNVFLRKSEADDHIMTMEGVIGEDYFKVRDALYDQYTAV